jgi:hypothetical protein
MYSRLLQNSVSNVWKWKGDEDNKGKNQIPTNVPKVEELHKTFRQHKENMK